MVESATGLIDEKLTAEWNKMAEAQEATRTFLSHSVAKLIPSEGGSFNMRAFFNQKLVRIS
jgi:hypothetical protein